MNTSNASIAKKIKIRGHTKVVVRPSQLKECRIDRSKLFETLLVNEVHLRGWPFPCINPQLTELENFKDRIEVTCDRDLYLQSTVLFESGQFTCLSGIREDWRDQSKFDPADDKWMPGEKLSIVDTVFIMTEYFAFASRISSVVAKDEDITVAVSFHGLMGRKIFFEPASSRVMMHERKTSEEQWVKAISVHESDLRINHTRFALESLQDLFKCFGWTPDISLLSDIQQELLKGRQF
jgi:hypothetical protein